MRELNEIQPNELDVCIVNFCPVSTEKERGGFEST